LEGRAPRGVDGVAPPERLLGDEGDAVRHPLPHARRLVEGDVVVRGEAHVEVAQRAVGLLHLPRDELLGVHGPPERAVVVEPRLVVRVLPDPQRPVDLAVHRAGASVARPGEPRVGRRESRVLGHAEAPDAGLHPDARAARAAEAPPDAPAVPHEHARARPGVAGNRRRGVRDAEDDPGVRAHTATPEATPPRPWVLNVSISVLSALVAGARAPAPPIRPGAPPWGVVRGAGAGAGA